jgi:hypothetical protein
VDNTQGAGAVCLGLSYYPPFRTREASDAENYQTNPFSNFGATSYTSPHLFRSDRQGFHRPRRNVQGLARLAPSIFTKRTHCPRSAVSKFRHQRYPCNPRPKEITERSHSSDSEQNSCECANCREITKRTHAFGAPVQSLGFEVQSFQKNAKRTQPETSNPNLPNRTENYQTKPMLDPPDNLRSPYTDVLGGQQTNGIGTGGGGRTHTLLRVPDFESSASANSATPAMKWGGNIVSPIRL